MREWMLLSPVTPPEILAQNETAAPCRWGFPAPPLHVIVSGGGAAARLVEGPELSTRRLWLGGQTIDDADLAMLMTARQEQQIIPLEEAWRAHLTVVIPSETEFEPYAAIAQWLLDEL